MIPILFQCLLFLITENPGPRYKSFGIQNHQSALPADAIWYARICPSFQASWFCGRVSHRACAWDRCSVFGGDWNSSIPPLRGNTGGIPPFPIPSLDSPQYASGYLEPACTEQGSIRHPGQKGWQERCSQKWRRRAAVGFVFIMLAYISFSFVISFSQDWSLK